MSKNNFEQNLQAIIMLAIIILVSIVGGMLLQQYITPESVEQDSFEGDPGFIKGARISNKATGEYVCTFGVDCICMSHSYYLSLTEGKQ